ncbi:MAG: DUF72 domain-containing protein [Candidatus Helarchaeales archaeon]
MARIHVGTSGWSYDDWIGPVYPYGMKKSKMLDFYIRLFSTCEINTSFYHIPSDIIVNSWNKKVPDGFQFAVKIFRGITHEAKLNPRKMGSWLDIQMRVFSRLDKKVHSYLLQLPPSFSRNDEEHLKNLEFFLETWRKKHDTRKLTVEFRNLSWMVSETFKLLSEYQATYCVVIEPLLPPRVEITNPEKTYIRFHGFGRNPWFNYRFSIDELKAWKNKIQEISKKVDDVHIYFNNHFSGYAVQNSLELMDLLEIKHVPLRKIQALFSPTKGQKSLDAFT